MKIIIFLLLTLTSIILSQEAPEEFNVVFETTMGNAILHVKKQYSPNGVQRFYELIQKKYYDENGLFRFVKNFVVQWGINGDPKTSSEWKNKNIPDDPVKLSNLRGVVSFAMTSEKNSRTTQVYVNFGNNSHLDKLRFAGIGKFDEAGVKIMESAFSGYAQRPNQGLIYSRGNAYLKRSFPKLSYINRVYILEENDQLNLKFAKN
eukprot:NODE_4211_length_686_cov_28.428571_g3579_i0.p1 GENE.NODE_4211_length_686_cov_28.428571_g3579_i0~~NODE_4211_length_686_cov_28.428571_g3579_i0.p1  ORF type:complete len:218 (+),score=6.54 NODE_4211_length_686_cov_28.428571_g3579_i0:42-656(+)